MSIEKLIEKWEAEKKYALSLYPRSEMEIEGKGRLISMIDAFLADLLALKAAQSDNKPKSRLIESLKEYLDKTPIEEVQAKLRALENRGFEGPTVDEFLQADTSDKGRQDALREAERQADPFVIITDNPKLSNPDDIWYAGVGTEWGIDENGNRFWKRFNPLFIPELFRSKFNHLKYGEIVNDEARRISK